MRVQRVRPPGAIVESWTLLGADHLPVEPVERWLAYLSSAERSPNTVKSYAHDLKDWFGYLIGRGIDWREVRLEDIGGFIGWLRLPPAARAGGVLALPSAGEHCSNSSVNRKLSALSSFYEFHARHGLDLGELLITWRPYAGSRTAWKPFLQHIAKDQLQRRRTVALRAPKPVPRVLTADEAQAVLDACTRRRDRLLFAVLHDAGVRIGEALGLRHEDVSVAGRTVTVMPRVNDNGARTKSAKRRTIPVSAQLMRLYADYLELEYGDLDSDYVFVNLWGGTIGRPLSYDTAHDLVERTRRASGVHFDPHWFRHTYATELLRRRTPIESVAALLGHASITTTLEIYGHLTIEDARRALEAAGWLPERQVNW
ncbi:site-specific integrase [Nonomuraea candida]|uniref:site-specific integrase n=1 Tax=Nonomuraea candida TaxID=359159 RepID=UPI0005BCADD2|nr:site-specific integrase [Nonomuraea candida]